MKRRASISVLSMRWLFDFDFSSSFLLSQFWFLILKLVLNIFLVRSLNINSVLITSLRHIPLRFSISSYSQRSRFKSRLIILLWHRISPNLIKLLQSLGFVPCHSNHKLLASVLTKGSIYNGAEYGRHVVK